MRNWLLATAAVVLLWFMCAAVTFIVAFLVAFGSLLFHSAWGGLLFLCAAAGMVGYGLRHRLEDA